MLLTWDHAASFSKFWSGLVQLHLRERELGYASLPSGVGEFLDVEKRELIVFDLISNSA